MARNRKRRGERSADADVEAPRPGVATARAGREGPRRSRVDDPSDPLGQSAPDVELAEAQLRAGEDDGESAGEVASEPDADELDDVVVVRSARGRGSAIGFARGSWRELQRVQWPDQRQVVQATGVVIGFVIVAGAYLGLADWVAGKIVHFILS